MATVSVSWNESSGGLSYTVTYTLTYTVSSTNTATTLTLNSLKATTTGGALKTTPLWTVIADGSTIATGYDVAKTFSGVTKTWQKGTSSASKTLRFTVDTIQKTATITVPALASYDVTYNANGGSGAPATQKKYYGMTLTLSSTRPTRTNYVFKRWNTNTSDTGTPYNPGDSYTTNAALALNAIWYPPHTVTYNANGGTSAPASQYKVYGTNLVLTTVKPTRENGVFQSWNTAADGSGTTYQPGDTYTAEADLALYAIWKAIPTITSLTAYRCDENGDQADEGHYGYISVTWSIPSGFSASDVGTLTGSVTPQTGSAITPTFTGATSGAGGTATAIVPGLDTDMQYTVSVSVANGTIVTTRNTLITRAFFIMDFKAGGGAIGIGRAAPLTGLEVGYDATFDAGVNMLEGMQIASESAYPLYIRSSVPASTDTMPTLPCFVYCVTDNGLYYCESDS